jgi:hypothetical protein
MPPPPRRITKPDGQPTRGKTGRNRLRQIDNLIALYDPGLIRREDGQYRGAFFVDLGYGWEPVTTLESANRLRRLNPTLCVLGVEIDPERVAAAAPSADERTCFRLGGFNLPLSDGEHARLVRAFNVLRQYDESAVEAALKTMGGYLLPGGLLIEGTSDPSGRVWVANLLRRSASGELLAEALVFGTNFRAGFEPGQFQPVLPKKYIHRMIPGQSIYQFVSAWKRAYYESIPTSVWGPRYLFATCARRLAETGYQVDLSRRLLGRGFLIWRHPEG